MSRKKIATFTVHNGYNYGASLQAYSTVQFLRNNGYDANLIDYRNPLIESKNKPKKSGGFKAFIGNLLNRKGKRLRRERFDAFGRLVIDSDNINIPADKLPTLCEKYDGFITGSDQVWNPDITGYDTTYFLKFADNVKNTVAYAPSVGHHGEYREDVVKFIEENLKYVNHLSVREQQNCELIERISQKACPVVLDPVFLLGADGFKELAATSAVKFNKRYAVYYTLFEDVEFFEFAKADSKKRGLKLYVFNLSGLVALKKGCKTFAPLGIGPAEFVAAFQNAEFVYTNSFHGTVFSLIFNKPFITALLSGKQSGKNSRINTILKVAGLESRIYSRGVDYKEDIDWESVNERIEEKAELSRKYLIEAINE